MVRGKEEENSAALNNHEKRRRGPGENMPACGCVLLKAGLPYAMYPSFPSLYCLCLRKKACCVKRLAVSL